jgi:type III secretion system FlhB-like substrate exporter
MPSALERPQVVTEYLANECAEGRVLGPLNGDEFQQVHTSRFGVIPKGSTGKWRLIVDMSSPEGASVNDAIKNSLCSLTYVGTKDAAREIVARGRGALMAKVDIKSAYRNIPVHPDDRWLMGMLWEGALFIDTALPFGLRSAPNLFSAVAEWIVKREGHRPLSQ